MRVRLYLGIAAVVCLGLLSRPLLAHAATNDISLTTSPVVLDLNIHPGSSDTRTLQLMNNGQQDIRINMELDVFSAKGDSGDAQITAPEPGDPSPGWVSFSPASFVAKPGVWSAVKMTINLPQSATLGYYYAAVFKPDLPDKTLANATTIRGANAIFVLVDTHAGSESRQLSIDDFGVSQDVYEYLPTTFHLTIQNNGNIYQAPTGSIFISKNSDLTNNVAALDVNPGGGNILPHTSRTFDVDWSDGFPIFADKKVNGLTVYDSQGKPVKELSWSFARFNKVRIGKYYAKVTLVYSDGKRVIPITRVVSFWVIPWKLILVVIAILAVLIVGLANIGRFAFYMGTKARIYRR